MKAIVVGMGVQGKKRKKYLEKLAKFDGDAAKDVDLESILDTFNCNHC